MMVFKFGISLFLNCFKLRPYANGIIFFSALVTSYNFYQYNNNCDKGWFGDRCQFQCHCREDAGCDERGFCSNGCDPSWFGPACQYYSLPIAWDTVTQRLIDQDDNTCTDKTSIANSITARLDTPYPLTWVRVVVNDPEHLGDLMLRYQTVDGSTRLGICDTQKSAFVAEKIMDIWCIPSNKTRVSSVVLIGRSVRNLCSLYISGGRNVALKQSTQQSSVYEGWASENAVDGGIDGNYVQPEDTCFQTEPWLPYQERSWWTVHLKPISYISAVTITFPEDSYQESRRPDQFQLRAYSAPDSQSSYMHIESIPKASRQISMVMVINWPVEKVMIQAISQRIISSLLFCEVMVFGEAACPAGSFGLECEHVCNCAEGQGCFVSTGGCPSGCASGYTGDNCLQLCDAGTYGAGCTERCSVHCAGGNRTCSAVDGSCLSGCQPGYQGPLCKAAGESKS
ncbi:hypothetical protein EGW08_017014 [Elysia chlorotica]|uniref:Fucolectin tachylectin-4 pentraxin-1 domain-containing protein n=1 Tax=Elysia chlorotica TaxID=188477 RepID=A0A433T102_ELYCH|nr:hypothetical protein EGW08_017014 [Elysia chlorotica]